jgi:hypothetical protein
VQQKLEEKENENENEPGEELFPGPYFFELLELAD